MRKMRLSHLISHWFGLCASWESCQSWVGVEPLWGWGSVLEVTVVASFEGVEVELGRGQSL
jgi:hypothetical protein